MIYHYDLHIHSVLSPCADVLMTPNNIFNMVMLKGLDIIAITDHNSLKQLPVCYELSKSYDILFIPGVEITLAEGFDLLIYFKSLDDALAFDSLIENKLKKNKFDESFYGTQEIMDIYDQVIENYPYLLIEPLLLSVTELKQLLKPFKTLIFIPHLKRQPENIFTLVSDLKINAIESNDFMMINTKLVNNSDAHQITEISEPHIANEIILKSLTINDFFRYFEND